MLGFRKGRKMSKYRSVFIILSAFVWAFALYGISKFKPTYFVENFPGPVVVTGVPDIPPPPPPPPPSDDHPPPRPLKDRQTIIIPNMTHIPQDHPFKTAENVPSVIPTNFVNSEETTELPPKPVAIIPPPPPQEQAKCKATGPIKLNQYDISGAYPSEAEEKEIQGSASIDVSVDNSGHVLGAKVVAASDNVFRSTSVAREARSLKFKPAIGEDCNPISSSYTINVVFKL